MEFYGNPWKTNGNLWNPWNSVEIQWESKKFNGNPWNPIGIHGV